MCVWGGWRGWGGGGGGVKALVAGALVEDFFYCGFPYAREKLIGTNSAILSQTHEVPFCYSNTELEEAKETRLQCIDIRCSQAR